MPKLTQLLSKWKEILLVVLSIVIVFYAGRGFQNWQTTKLARENVAMRQQLEQTNKLLNSFHMDENARNIWNRLGYRVTKPLPPITGDSTDEK